MHPRRIPVLSVREGRPGRPSRSRPPTGDDHERGGARFHKQRKRPDAGTGNWEFEYDMMAPPARRSGTVDACRAATGACLQTSPAAPRRAGRIRVLFEKLPLFQCLVVAIGFHGVGDEVTTLCPGLRAEGPRLRRRRGAACHRSSARRPRLRSVPPRHRRRSHPPDDSLPTDRSRGLGAGPVAQDRRRQRKRPDGQAIAGADRAAGGRDRRRGKFMSATGPQRTFTDQPTCCCCSPQDRHSYVALLVAAQSCRPRMYA